MQLLANTISFFLLGHKADHFFECDCIILQCNTSCDIPFCLYLSSHNNGFPCHPIRKCPVWYIYTLVERGLERPYKVFVWSYKTPFDSRFRLSPCIAPITHSWFLQHLRRHFLPTSLAIPCVQAPPLCKQGSPPRHHATSHWVSETFQVYIYQHPVLLASLLYGRP